ncbi:hypothetical protein Y032_0047g1466 [Ancylostoma ceylanicum]|uniref:Uncharacterized protein n=1 Tax=Ancylostoma ceylanicum TaxID=53326 RepID=A0A016UCS7_9BILA|nr:hypothetical protein Y032_0047g1466 [Ancylostoma ceylanicum]
MIYRSTPGSKRISCYPTGSYSDAVEWILEGVTIGAIADPVQRLRANCRKRLARSLSTKDSNGWNGSASARICNATSTPG